MYFILDYFSIFPQTGLPSLSLSLTVPLWTEISVEGGFNHTPLVGFIWEYRCLLVGQTFLYMLKFPPEFGKPH